MGKTRWSFAAEKKLEVVAYAEEPPNNTKAAEKYEVDESCVRDWRKNKAILEAMPKTFQ